MDFANLLDGPSAAIVIGGTLAATWLRCGSRDCGQAVAALAALWRPRFDADAAKAELAAQVREIRAEGLIRAKPHHFGDREFDEGLDALIGGRSLAGVLKTHESHRARRIEASSAAVRTLAQGAELAPVFGLAGTLISLSQLPADGLARGAFAGAIAMAVLTTLYGLLLANLLLAPLARVIERRAQAEEAGRDQLVEWLAAQVAPELARRRPAPPETLKAAAA